MPDFEREDDWWRNGQNLYLDNMAVTGFYRVPLSSAQAGDILLCCFGASVANHAAIYCGNGELLHHLPEQLSKRERYSEKWQTTNAFSLASPPLARICLHGGFATIWPPPQPVCEHGSGSHPGAVVTGAGFRRQMNEGWYQIRIRGEDTAPEAVYARLHEQLGEGAVIHIVPRLAGAGKGGLQIVLGAAAIVGSFFTAGASMALWGFSPGSRWFFCHHDGCFHWGQHDTGWCGTDACPEAKKTPEYRATDNGRQNTYFSSLDNMIAQGNPMPVPYGEMLVGSANLPGHSVPVMKAGDGKMVVIGRQA